MPLASDEPETQNEACNSVLGYGTCNSRRPLFWFAFLSRTGRWQTTARYRSPNKRFAIEFKEPWFTIGEYPLRIDFVEDGRRRTVWGPEYEFGTMFTFAYWRPSGNEVAVVACGFGKVAKAYRLPEMNEIPFEPLWDDLKQSALDSYPFLKDGREIRTPSYFCSYADLRQEYSRRH